MNWNRCCNTSNDRPASGSNRITRLFSVIFGKFSSLLSRLGRNSVGTSLIGSLLAGRHRGCDCVQTIIQNKMLFKEKFSIGVTQTALLRQCLEVQNFRRYPDAALKQTKTLFRLTTSAIVRNCIIAGEKTEFVYLPLVNGQIWLRFINLIEHFWIKSFEAKHTKIFLRRRARVSVEDEYFCSREPLKTWKISRGRFDGAIQLLDFTGAIWR